MGLMNVCRVKGILQSKGHFALAGATPKPGLSRQAGLGGWGGSGSPGAQELCQTSLHLLSQKELSP